MTKQQRKLLFLTLFVSFLILAPAFALYSQGYRIDFQGKRITQTGAFYFKVAPTRADILVDGNFIKKTDFLFGSALTKNFFPSSYFVEIIKEGYHSWQKILEVKERMVTEAKSILLFKKDPVFQKLSDEVVRFWISPNKQYALLEKRGLNTSWELRLLNLETGGEEPFLPQRKGEIFNIEWTKDSQRFLLSETFKEQIVSTVYGISQNQPCSKTPCALEYLREETGNISISSFNADQVFFTKFLNTTQVLFTANYVKEETALPLANNVLAFKVNNNYASWLDKDGTLWQQDLREASKASVFQESVFIPKQETLYKLFVGKDAIFVQENTTLFLHKKNSSKRNEILSPALELQVSPGEDKVAIKNHSELWVLFLEEETEQPQHKAEELILLTRFSEPIEQLSWIDSSYLLFSLKDTVRTMEIDNRDRLNIANIAKFQEPKLFWDNEKGALYVLSKGTFSISEKLVR